MQDEDSPSGRIIWSVGHSTRSEGEFLALLRSYQIRYLVDVRRFPGSRRHPQFGRENLERALPGEGIAYVPLGRELGGFRKEGYEPYMRTEGFRRGLDRLMGVASRGATAVFCAEALFFRCHRSQIADELVRLGWKVIHIVSEGREIAHKRLPSQESLPV